MTDGFDTPWSPGTIWIDEDGSRLAADLTPGMRVRGRIVLVLDEQRYVLRVFNRNIVMRSALSFERLQEVELLVRQVHPELRLAPVSGGSDHGTPRRRTDLFI